MKMSATTSTTTMSAKTAPATVEEHEEPEKVEGNATAQTNAHSQQCAEEMANINVGVAAGGSLLLGQEIVITDSGRESMNECDSSLEDAAASEQLSKNPCTREFYTSSGSQTIWYLKTEDVQSCHTHKQPTRPCPPPQQQQAHNDDPEAAAFMAVDTRKTASTFPRTTTTNDSMSSIGSRNGFLSHQMRAVSSPSLTDALQESINDASANATTAAAAAAAVGIQFKAADAAAASTGSASSASSSSNTLSTSQSVGVLQKFRRTLTNFSKAPQPPRPASAACHTHTNGDNNSSSSNADAGATAQFYTSTSGGSLDVAHDVTDSASGKYRFGPLIWRTSKERRKTKHDRRGKCNSGDSGIQVELENDEHYARVIATGMSVDGSTAAAAAATSGGMLCAESENFSKLCGVRRVNSAKISSSTAAAASAKAKILKRIEVSNEREAPESLPTRSLSQPNGLETFGISKADLDESDSDSVTSHEEGPSYYPVYAEVLYSFSAAGPQELGLERGALIEVLRKEVGPWWFGRIKKEEASLVEEILDPELGWFPKEFVRVIQCPETDAFFLKHLTAQQQQQEEVAHTVPAATSDAETVSRTADGATVDEHNVTTIVIEPHSSNDASSSGEGSVATPLVPSRSANVIMDNSDLLRRSAVKELLDTEVNYVKLLASICEGYLPAMSKRIDIFSPHSIRLIFSNISAIFKFQRKFLGALRKGIEQNQIAKVFLTMHKEFLCYSTYCNAYPRALIELESYDRIKEAKIILDNCRESENLAELPLSAHLLAPVQRICRYPLHLGEIMKAVTKHNTETPFTQDLPQLTPLEMSQLDVADTRETITMALESMKGITEAVNEGKRHSETIARHQSSFQNFKGPPLYLHSTRFFLQIDATRQKQNLWNSSYTLFLFDNQLVYCKRDIIKRSHFIYKGRIFLDRCRVVNVRDGKMFGHTIKNSLRIYCEARDKWYDFSFRSANRKHRFLSTLALERQFGGKALYVAEMTGYEYAFEERDYSDQSDYDMPDSESGSGLAPLRFRECIYDVAAATGTGTTTTSASGGESSLPESPAKLTSQKYSDTLPKKSQTRDGSSGAGSTETSSLGRRRLGNWFRKPKSTNSTPNHSPTHKPATFLSTGDLHLPPSGGGTNATAVLVTAPEETDSVAKDATSSVSS